MPDMVVDSVAAVADQLRLTRIQERMLQILAERRGRTVSRGSLMDLLYGERPDPPMDEVLRVQVCLMRKRLRAIGPEWQIETVWGRGLRLPATAV